MTHNVSMRRVGDLISSPSDRARVYICEECVDVCNSIIRDKLYEAAATTLTQPRQGAFDPLVVPDLLDAVERWASSESAGQDASSQLDEVRRIAALMFNTVNRGQ